MKRFTILSAVLIVAFAAASAFATPQFQVWQDTDGDNVKDLFLGNIEAYSGALSGVDNYDYFGASGHPIAGPALAQFESKMFLYSGPDGLSFNMIHNKDNFTPYWNHVDWDLKVSGTPSSVLLSDDGAEAQSLGAVPGGEAYRGRWQYINNTDGGIIGHLQGNDWEIEIDPLAFGDIQTWDVYSGDGASINLWNNPTAPPTGLGSSDHYRLDTEAYTTYITAVPEPGTLILLGTGLAGLGAAYRRRRQT